MPGDARVPWHPQILADQLTLSQPGWADHTPTSLPAPPPGFSDLPTALLWNSKKVKSKFKFVFLKALALLCATLCMNDSRLGIGALIGSMNSLKITPEQ